MKYEVGDTVLLLHSNEEGTVVEIISKDMVTVNVEGVEFPVFVDQIDFPYFKRFSEQSKRKREQQKNQKVFIDQIKQDKKGSVEIPDNGVHFSFVPVYDTSLYEDDILHFKLYLVNKNNEAYQFQYAAIYKDGSGFEVTNEIRPQSDFYLHNISQEEINDIVRFHFLISLSDRDKFRADQIERPVRIKAKTLFQKIDDMHLRNEPSFGFELFHRYPDRTTEDFFPVTTAAKQPARPAAKKEPVRSVIDIHIEKITDQHAGMSNFEILQVQLQYFEKYYALAVANLQPKLIVIHGVGSGKLRAEIHERLRSKSEVKSFVNQYHPNFGFGATEIFFQYS